MKKIQTQISESSSVINQKKKIKTTYEKFYGSTEKFKMTCVKSAKTKIFK